MLKSVISKLEEALQMTPAMAQKEVTEALTMLKEIDVTTSPKHNYWDPRRKTIAVDFDGVIHSYQTPWQGPDVIPDPPLAGAFDWLANLTTKFQVLIFSARCNDVSGIIAMKAWFTKHGFPPLALEKLIFEPGKPSAHVFIDDRAWRFDGSFIGLAPGHLHNFKPWYYGQEGWGR